LGKGGADILTGGGGADEFNFDTSTTLGFPTITDFTPGLDKLRLSLKVFSNLGSLPSGATQTQLNANFFETGSGLSAASQSTTRLFYNQTTSTLYYDPDGTGAEAAKTLAVLSGVTTALASSDIYLFS
jgi:Ca2+-binding RTX toxin-like protein